MGWEADDGKYDYSYTPATAKKSAVDYAKQAGSVYVGKSTAKGVEPPVKKTLKTDSPTPLVFLIDVTGSMGKWPGIIFHKLPVLYNEAKLWLPEIEISFAAIGDAYTDRQPVQICEFGKGRALEKHINAIYPEGGGGGQGKESYELFAYYYLKHCEMPKAKRALLVYCGDEGFYERILPMHLERYFGDEAGEAVDSYHVFAELSKKFEVYNLRVKYNNDTEEQQIKQQWQKAIGNERVLSLDDPNRVVDCAIGLTALVAQEVDQFQDRLGKRQTDAQVDQVMRTLHPLLQDDGGAGKKKKKAATKKTTRKKT